MGQKYAQLRTLTFSPTQLKVRRLSSGQRHAQRSQFTDGWQQPAISCARYTRIPSEIAHMAHSDRQPIRTTE